MPRHNRGRSETTKRIMSGVMVLALLALPQLSRAAEIALDERACGSSRSLSLGDWLEVNLPGNPTTGYAWDVITVPSLLQKQQEPAHRSDSQRIGAGGITSFVFRVAAVGEGTLELAYRRPWEKNASPLRTCRIRLSSAETQGIQPAGKQIGQDSSPTPVKAQAATEGDKNNTPMAALAKKIENPIAHHITVPIKTDLDFGIGPERATRVTTAVKPGIPFSLNDEWALLVRTTVPFIYAEGTVRGARDTTGIGDITQSFYLTPATVIDHGWIWGLGPIFNYPTATDDALGRKKFSLGPTAALVRQAGPWIYGAVAAHLWSAESTDRRADVNASTVEPFVAYITKRAMSFGVNSLSRYDWRANQWSVPLNVSVGQALRICKQPVQFSLGGTYYAEKPAGGPDWGLSFTVTFLFSK